MTQIAEDNLFGAELSKFSEPKIQFWTLQVCAWLGYFVVVFVAIVHPQFDYPDFNLKGQIINLCIETISGFILSSLQWLFIRRIMHMSLRSTLMLSFLSASVLGCIFNIIKLASYKVIIYDQIWYQQLNMLEFGGWLLFSLATMFAFNSVFFIMLYNSRLKDEHEMLLRAQNSAKEAQLQMLRYQLNPHFMFNTLNAISTLIYKNENDKANEMLDQLCLFFRFSLDQTGNKTSTLQDEIKLVELYLSIEKVRFGDRLIISFDIDKDSRNAKVPIMLLQPLVENCIKHGIESLSKQGKIEIKSSVVDGMLNIDVTDNGDGQSAKNEQGFGIGLNNTQERLNTMFNKKCDVLITHLSSGGTQVSLKMPFITKL